MTLNYITSHLNTQEKCINYLEKTRWGEIPVCPYCSSTRSSPKALRHTCLSCNRSYSVKVGTFMENSNLPIQKWLMAIVLMLSAKKGVSALQLSRDLSINKNTAWFLQMRLRAAMMDGDLEKFIQRKLPEPNKSARKIITAQDAELKSTAGSSWSCLKRALTGQFHRVDIYYLSRYLDEIRFKVDCKHLPDYGYLELVNRIIRYDFAKY